MIDMNEYNRQEIEQLRANRSNGQVGDRPIILLTTTGAKSGKQYTTPLMYVPDGDRLLIIASNIGAPKHPAWYHNLRAHPNVTAEVGLEVYEATTTTAEGTEREQLWHKITELYPFFVEHQASTERQIPVVIIARQA